MSDVRIIPTAKAMSDIEFIEAMTGRELKATGELVSIPVTTPKHHRKVVTMTDQLWNDMVGITTAHAESVLGKKL